MTRVHPLERSTAAAAGFDAATFLANLEVLTEAEGGVGKLRALCLRLAFQSRFTSQRRLVPAVLSGAYAPIAEARGRDASDQIMPGLCALSVGPADLMIPEGWEWLPLVAVARLESGHTPSRKHADYWDGGVPWLGIPDARRHHGRTIQETIQTVSHLGLDNSSARLLPAGTVCLSRTASVGYVTVMGRSMATSQDFVNWVCSDRILPRFLMYLLVCEADALDRFSKGAVHQTIYFPEVKAFHIALPPVAEQKRIVAKVDQLMALCDDLEVRQAKKRETSTRLTKSALQALTTAEGPEEFDVAWKRVVDNFDVLIDRAARVADLRSTIVDLAVHGRFSGAIIGIEGLPAGWKWMKVDDLVAKKRHALAIGPFGSSLLKADYTESGVPLVFVRDITSRSFGGPNTRFVSEKKAIELAAHRVAAGDLLITKMGSPPGDTAIYPPGRPIAIVTADCIKLSPDPSLTTPNFLEIVLSAGSVRGKILEITKGVAHQKISLRRFREVRLPIPPLVEQGRIVEAVGNLMTQCDVLEGTLSRAEEGASRLVQSVVQDLVA